MSDLKPQTSDIVFLFDVDNTLLDNDHVTSDLKRHLEQEVGSERAQRYWAIFEQLRSDLGYADYLGALQRYRVEYPHELHLLTVSRFLINYPFADRLYPDAIKAIQHVKLWGTTAILSDGDVVFQPRKVDCSGLFEAVDGNVLIYVHKELELADVENRYPKLVLPSSIPASIKVEEALYAKLPVWEYAQTVRDDTARQAGYAYRAVVSDLLGRMEQPKEESGGEGEAA